MSDCYSTLSVFATNCPQYRQTGGRTAMRDAAFCMDGSHDGLGCSQILLIVLVINQRIVNRQQSAYDMTRCSLW